MPVETKVNVGGTWQTITAPEVNVGGTLQDIVEIEVNVGGTWQTVFEKAVNPDTLTLNTLSSLDIDTISPFSSQAGVRVLRDGTVEELIGFSDSWLAQNSGVEWLDNNAADVGDDYEVKLDKTSGPDPTGGPALGVFITISATRQWTLSSTIEEDIIFLGTMTIREIADTGNSVNATVTMEIRNGPP